MDGSYRNGHFKGGLVYGRCFVWEADSLMARTARGGNNGGCLDKDDASEGQKILRMRDKRGDACGDSLL